MDPCSGSSAFARSSATAACRYSRIRSSSLPDVKASYASYVPIPAYGSAILRPPAEVSSEAPAPSGRPPGHPSQAAVLAPRHDDVGVGERPRAIPRCRGHRVQGPGIDTSPAPEPLGTLRRVPVRGRSHPESIERVLEVADGREQTCAPIARSPGTTPPHPAKAPG